MESIMTKLPERNILDGSKLPKTTTGEMKGALGKLRDYLFELFGDDSSRQGSGAVGARASIWQN